MTQKQLRKCFFGAAFRVLGETGVIVCNLLSFFPVLWYDSHTEGGMDVEIKRRKRTPERPIDNPVRHAGGKTGYECKLLSADHPWQPLMAYHTTGEFSGIGHGFHKHCGPTAITNVLCTIARCGGPEKLLQTPPAEIFRRVAEIGQHRATYWNIKDSVPLGGTSYALLWGYVHTCLCRFEVRDVAVSARLLASSRAVAREIRRGSLLILSLYHHRCYGSHIVVAYGTVEVTVAGRAAPRLYLEVADGWSGRPRYIAAEDLRQCGYVAVRRSGRHQPPGGREASRREGHPVPAGQDLQREAAPEDLVGTDSI